MEHEILGQILTELRELKADVGELKADVAELKADVAELKADVAELKDDVAELKTDVAVLKTDVAELKADVKRLDTRVTSLEQYMDAARVSLINIEQVEMRKIAAALEGHDLNQYAIHGHEGRLTRLEEVAERHTLEIAVLKHA